MFSFVDYFNVNDNLSNGTLNVNFTDNEIILSWNSDTPVSIENGTILELEFIANTVNTVTSGLFIWNTADNNCQYLDEFGNVLPAAFIDGIVTIYASPGMPGLPDGPLNVNTAENPVSEYYINTVENAIWYEWMLTPPEAGNISYTDTAATVNWNLDFNDTAYIYVIAGNDCEEISYSDTLSVNVFFATEIRSYNNTMVNIYPNPANGRFSVSMGNGNTSINLILTDCNGKIVLDQTIENESFIDISHLANGVYLIKMNYKTSSSSNSIIKKIVKQ